MPDSSCNLVKHSKRLLLCLYPLLGSQVVGLRYGVCILRNMAQRNYEPQLPELLTLMLMGVCLH